MKYGVWGCFSEYVLSRRDGRVSAITWLGEKVVKRVLVTTSLGKEVNKFLVIILMGKDVIFYIIMRKKIKKSTFFSLCRCAGVKFSGSVMTVWFGGKEMKPGFI